MVKFLCGTIDANKEPLFLRVYIYIYIYVCVKKSCHILYGQQLYHPPAQDWLSTEAKQG